MNPQDYMKIALQQAAKAFEKDEVPIGAVVADPETGEIIARAYNRCEHGTDAFAHAEIEAMRKACRKLKQNRLRGLVLYVTLEPCTMCAAAISFMRIKKVYFGAADAKGGGVVSGVHFYEAPTCHHRPEVQGGILAEPCSEILKRFFQGKRGKKL